jgi:hypothetical protein
MLKCKPAQKVAASMPAKERRLSPAILDIRAESKSKDITRVLIDVVFQSVPLPRPVGRGYWYAACRGAQVELRTLRGDILSNTPPSTLEFTYHKDTSIEKERSFELKPKAKIEAGPVKGEASGPGAKSRRKSATSEGFDYTGRENELSAAATSRRVSWQMSMVRVDHAISDYLFGNLPLWAECESNAKPVKGAVRLLPSIFSFDEDKRQMSDLHAFLMQLALAFRSVKVMNQDETEVSFEDFV